MDDDVTPAQGIVREPSRDELLALIHSLREELDAGRRARQGELERTHLLRCDLLQAYKNLTSVQTRCTELLEEVRSLRSGTSGERPVVRLRSPTPPRGTRL